MAWTKKPDNCTYATCSVAVDGELHYIPTLAGNILYLAIFALYLVLQWFQGIRYRTWGYLIAMTGGLVLEIVGYGARIMLHHNIFDKNTFIMYLVGLTIGPAFFSAAIYLCLGRIIVIYGSDLSLLKPRTVTCVFVCCDIISLVLQAAGGGMTSSATTVSDHNTGINTMIAGLSSQVASMTIFVCFCAHYGWSVFRSPGKINPTTAEVHNSFKFKLFLVALAVATVTILVRCCFRVAELSDGFDGSLANNQVVFMILEGVMMIIAVGALTVAHPGFILGRALWEAATFHFRTRESGSDIKADPSVDPSEPSKELTDVTSFLTA